MNNILKIAFPIVAILGFFLIRGRSLNMQISETGKDIIRNLEGFSATRYPDGKGYSIGYGHQILPGESFVEPISKEIGELLLESDSAKSEKIVNSSVKVPLKQNQFDALVSFVYNVGANAFKNSSMLRYINSGRNDLAADEFNRWVYYQGSVNKGLVARREKEKKLFLT